MRTIYRKSGGQNTRMVAARADEPSASRLETNRRCRYGVHVPVAAATETTSSSRSFKSLLATSTPEGGVPAVAPGGTAGSANFRCLQLARDLNALAHEVLNLLLVGSGQFERGVSRRGFRLEDLCRHRRVGEDELIPCTDAGAGRPTTTLVLRLAVVRFLLYSTDDCYLLFRLRRWRGGPRRGLRRCLWCSLRRGLWCLCARGDMQHGRNYSSGGDRYQ